MCPVVVEWSVRADETATAVKKEIVTEKFI